jgi:hypothetical protein
MHTTASANAVECKSSLTLVFYSNFQNAQLAKLAIGNRAYNNKADLRRLRIEPAKAGFAVVAAT